MSLTAAPKIIGNHVYFYLDAQTVTVPASPGGPSTRTNKPGSTDPLWVDVGVVKNLDIQRERQKRERYTPNPGVLRLNDILETKSKITVKFTGDDLSPLAIELIFGTLKLTAASTQYNPLEGVAKTGWLKVQQYDQGDVLVNTVDLYCYLEIAGATKFGDDIVECEYEATVLHSIYNTGTL